MASAAKFWPRALFKLGAAKEASPNFVPTTDIAARIVGTAAPRPVAPPPSPPIPAAPETPAYVPWLDEAAPADDLLDGDDAEADLSRQSERFVPDKTATTLTDKRGKVVRARIINLSSTGVAVEADFRIIPASTVAMVGAKPVKPGRAIRGGHVFVFDKPLDPARCNKQIVL